ncbi:hypothetical protein ACW910_21700 (plasmid) [Burkholderia ambifaria]
MSISASGVVASSAAAISGVVASATGGFNVALVGLVGTVLGAVIGQGVAWVIATTNRADAARRDAISRAFDTAGSHMAIVAFDRYVQFCEEYTTQFREAIAGIIQTGPHENAITYSGELLRLRTRWALWVTDDVNTRLERFEKVLRQMGSDAHLSSPELAASVPNQSELINRMYKAFSDLLALGNWNGEEADKDIAIATMVSHLKETLGIEQFGMLRQLTLKNATGDLAEGKSRNGNAGPPA